MQTAVNHPEYTGPATSKEEVVARIKNSDEWAIGALLRIYSFQTGDEQLEHRTKNQNDVGFNAFDAEILTSISEFYNKKQFLSPKQLAFVKRSIIKYSRQLVEAGFSPVEIKDDGFKKKEVKEFKEIKSAQLIVNRETIVIRFQFPKGDKAFFDTVNKIKSLPGRRFVKEPQPRWEVPVTLSAVKQLKKWGFDFDQDLTNWYDKIGSPVIFDSNLEIPGLNATLRPFQKEGVAFINACNGRALVADEMGLGKTIQALAYLQLHPELRPAVIVVPASLKLNWHKEIKQFMDGKNDIYIVNSKPKNNPDEWWYKSFQVDQSKHSSSKNQDIIIINYDILGNKLKTITKLDPAGKPLLDANGKPQKKVIEIERTGWVDYLIDIKPKVMICDEIHYIKNRGKVRTVGAQKLGKKAKHIIGLSGTPIENRPIEFYTTIKMISPKLIGGHFNFAKKYCGAHHNGFGWDYTGATNIEELHELLTSTIMVRRKKIDVLKELPAKVRTVVPIEISNRREYNRAENDIIQWIAENCGTKAAAKAQEAKALVEFEKLKQLAMEGKIKNCLSWIEDFLESGKKLIVFTTHTSTIEKVIKHFGKDICVRLDGSTNTKNRQKAVDDFQNKPKIKLFVGNVKAAGVGITLTAASDTCFLELPWTPGAADQAEDRVHRIGQEADSVNAWYLLADDTKEIDIAELLDAKRKVLSKVVDGKPCTDKEMLIANNSIVKDLMEDM